MENNEQVADTLNDLVKINNDRMEGYTKAMEETKTEDGDLAALFEKMKLESFQLRQELAAAVSQFGEKGTQETRLDGKLYRVWMDVKASFSGNSRKSILENCEFGEDAAQKAYQTVLSDDSLPVDIRKLLTDQMSILKASHNRIKQMRDSES